MTGTTQPFCNGMGCPQKLSCGRYKEGIDMRKEDHFPMAPYSHIEKRCTFYVGDKPETFVNTIKDIINGKGRKD